MGAADTLTAEYFSDLLGVATVQTEATRKEAGIEGDLEFGQKNISTTQRKLLNADEILRLPYNKLIVNVRGNKPLLLNKMIYTEHKLAKHLKDVPVSQYRPEWNKNKNKIVSRLKKEVTNTQKQEEIQREQLKQEKNKQEIQQKENEIKPKEKTQEEINKESFRIF